MCVAVVSYDPAAVDSHDNQWNYLKMMFIIVTIDQ